MVDSGEIATSVSTNKTTLANRYRRPYRSSTVSERETISDSPTYQHGQQCIWRPLQLPRLRGVRWRAHSHTIDPTTGTPIAGGAPSVTVAAEPVALADAWATALTATLHQQGQTSSSTKPSGDVCGIS